MGVGSARRFLGRQPTRVRAGKKRLRLESTSVALYRSMRPGEDGKPVIGRNARALGVRFEGIAPDIPDTTGGVVSPLGGGMSVAKDWHDLPEHRIPSEMGGTGKMVVMFALEEESLPDELTIRQQGQNKGHYVVEPKRRMPIQEYEALLGGTQAKWEQVTE